MTVIDEIDEFFEELRRLPSPWPENMPKLSDPVAAREQEDLRTAYEENLRQFALEIDAAHRATKGLYEVGGDEAEGVDVLDGLIAVIRRKEPIEQRFQRLFALLIQL